MRPSLSSTSEYRSETFAAPTRTIEDFGIDLSKIMGTILEVDPDNLPKYEWDWGTEGEDEGTNEDGATASEQNTSAENQVDDTPDAADGN